MFVGIKNTDNKYVTTHFDSKINNPIPDNNDSNVEVICILMRQHLDDLNSAPNIKHAAHLIELCIENDPANYTVLLENFNAGSDASTSVIAKKFFKILGREESDLFQGFDLQGMETRKSELKEEKKQLEQEIFNRILTTSAAEDSLLAIKESNLAEKKRQILNSEERQECLRNCIEAELKVKQTVVVVFEDDELFNLDLLDAKQGTTLSDYLKTKKVYVYGYIGIDKLRQREKKIDSRNTSIKTRIQSLGTILE